jgi:DNA polymerase-1
MTEIEELFALANNGARLTKKEMAGIRFNTLDLAGPHRAAIVEYGCDDAVLELCHHHHRYPRVKDSLIYRLEMACLPLSVQMADNGIKLDWPMMREGALRARLFQDRMVPEIIDDFNALLLAAGQEKCRPDLNLRSPAQLVKIMFEQIGMPVHRRTPRKRNKKGELTGGTPSTDADTALVPLVSQYPVVQKIIDYRQLDKLAGTYLEKYEQDYTYCPCGRTHPNWMQAGVPAGRWACSRWPVQQSPKVYHFELRAGDCFDYNFRDAVVAPEDWYFLGFDYAQIERRVFAGEAQDPALLEAFRSGVDIHKQTAADLFRISIEDVTPKQRSMGKTTGFGMDYGLGEEGLADRLGISLAEAVALRDAYFAAYACLKPWTARTVAQAKRDGFVLTGGFKRRVPIWEFESQDRRIYSEGERLAGNAPIQGGAADYMKVSMARADAALEAAGLRDKIRLIMNMHDMLGWYAHESVPPLRAIQVLQPAVVWTAPFIAHWPPMKAEWHMGRRWGSVREAVLDLDPTGYPVGLELEKPKPKPAPEAAGTATGAQEAGPVLCEGMAGPGIPVRAHSSGGAPLVISVDEMPQVQAVRDLIATLSSRPGGTSVILRTPEGEVEVAKACGLTPAHHPEVTLMLGVTARLSYAVVQPA